MVKELRRTNLDLENEIIRRKREEKKEKEEVVKLQVKLEDLQNKLDTSRGDSDDDGEVTNLQIELERKQRKLKNIKELTHELKDKMHTTHNTKAMSKAQRVVRDIGNAIESIGVPKRQTRTKAISKTHVYSGPIIEEEKMPLCTKIEEIFLFAEEEIRKVLIEKEKAELEYRLISGLKNNLHKENISWKQDLQNMFAGRRSLLDIQNRMEDQSSVLESEKRDLATKIDKWSRQEKILSRINSKQDIIKGSTSSVLSRNIQDEINSDYEHYMRTYIYKVPVRHKEAELELKPISRLGIEKNYSTMYGGFARNAPKYMNLNRLMIKVFPRDVMTNNFFSSMSRSALYDSSFVRRPRISHL